MRTNKSALTLLSIGMLLILWGAGFALSVVLDRYGHDGWVSAVSRQEVGLASGATLEPMPELMAQGLRHIVAVRLESTPNHARQHDLKKFHAVLAVPASSLAALSLRLPQGIFTQPVPKSWHGFFFSSRSPPLAG